MYCRKCGKFIDYEADICKECCAKESAIEEKEVATAESLNEVEERVVQNESVNQEQEIIITCEQDNYVKSENRINTNKKLGFSKALTATILSVIANSMIGAADIFMQSGISWITGEQIVEDPVAMFWVASFVAGFLAMIALGLAIPGLIMGIQSILLYVKTVKSGGVKPVVTLVLGIIGVAFAVGVIASTLILLLEFSYVIMQISELIA